MSRREGIIKATVTIRLDARTRRRIAAKAKAHGRTLPAQVEYYVHMGMAAEENPDLPVSFIAGILEGRQAVRAGLGKPYAWGIIGRRHAQERS